MSRSGGWGLGLVILGWVGAFVSAPIDAAIMAAVRTPFELALIRWAWANAKTDLAPRGALPLEYIEVAIAYTIWLAIWPVATLTFSIAPFAFEMVSLPPGVTQLLRALGWLVLLTPNVPPSERRSLRSWFTRRPNMILQKIQIAR